MSKWNRIFRKAAAFLLTACLAGTCTDTGAFALLPAYAATEEKEVILSFEALPEDVSIQEIAVGAEETEIVFPEELTVTLLGRKRSGEPYATLSDAEKKASSSNAVMEASSSDADDDDDKLSDGEIFDDVTPEKGEETVLPVKEWKLNKSLSSADSFTAETAGGCFVFEPVIPDGYFLSDEAELPGIRVSVVLPAFEAKETVDGVTVTVTAEEGAFPAGAKLVVAKVPAAKEEKAAAAVEQQREAGRNVAVSYTFDIRIEDGEGKELQPEEGKQVKVAFSMAEAAQENLEADIYHITEEENKAGEVRLAVSKLETEVDGEAETVSAETEGFSLYTVEFTYQTLQYVVEGGAKVPLKEILEKVGLAGEVTDAEASDSTLFSVTKESGEWFVVSHQAFSSTEWLKVTINGIVYEITVTDAVEVYTWAALQAEFNKEGTMELELGDDVTAGSSDVGLKVPSSTTVTLDLKGHTLNRGLTEWKKDGYVMMVQGKLILKDTSTSQSGTITGGYDDIYSLKCGGIYVAGGSVEMYGGTISENKAGESGGVYVMGSSSKTGTFTMDGGRISNNYANGNAGGVRVGYGGKFVLNKGEISHNEAKNSAGGVYCQGELIMNGGSISYNKAIKYAGVCVEYVGGGAKFTMNDGSIDNNASNTDAGGVHSSLSSELILTGGSIINNKTESGEGGGVCVMGSCKMEGNIEITGNKSGSNDSNLYVAAGQTVTLTGALTGSPIGVRTEKTPGETSPVDFATASTSGWLVPSKFVSENKNYYVDKKGSNALALYAPTSVTVSGIKAKNRIYDGTDAAELDWSSAVISGKKPEDDVKVTGATGKFADKNAGSDKTVTISDVKLGGADADRYKVVSTASTTASISKKKVTVSGINAKDKTYDGNTQAELEFDSAVISEKLPEDDLKVTDAVGTFDGPDADYHNVNVSGFVFGGADAGNYYADGSITISSVRIEQRKVGLSWGGTEFVYNGSAQKPDVTVTGLVGSDTCTASVTGEGTDAGSSYVAIVSGLSNPNYTTPAEITRGFTISRAPLTVTTQDASKVYDGTPLTAAGSLSGLVGSETATLKMTGSRTDTGSCSNTYEILWDGTAKEGNYQIASETLGTLTVTEYAGQIDVTTTGGTFTYDGLPHGASVTVSPLPAGYTLVSASSGASATDVTATDLTATADTLVIENASHTDVTGNLNIKKTDGIISVIPAPLTVITPDASKVYDGTALTAAGSLSGLVAGETATLKTTGSQTDAGSGSNTYEILWDGTAKEGNYQIASETLGTLKVDPKEVTVSGITAENKVSDGTTAARLRFDEAVISGKVAGDDLGATGTGTFASALPGDNIKVTISGLTLTGADAGNYTLAASGSQTETQANIRSKSSGSDDSDDSRILTGGTWHQFGENWTYTFANGREAKAEWAYAFYLNRTDWYRFGADGIMLTGWYEENGKRYYLNPVSDGTKGRMFIGWTLIDGKWYFFEPQPGKNQGRMYRNEQTPDGYFVGEDGVWVR